ncbi:unnamed protein product (macronuclear) [Paramecium tetraurelia]|uniref:Uncharacterized protein n=1 Tax=Paramecium tetraurelia TaxID=5888 RepID=A0BPK8_PARTE|nr:uncharacterized protein GSPATT00005224001 [Paramecium tetraurelia]CAK60475.1 unnamed protein product [Paramecium tetraurelia]|eukprot:XP_001427873.1 hypothetical protein (macronuclear) [Paramecium tetraurelia strain d4-2]
MNYYICLSLIPDLSLMMLDRGAISHHIMNKQVNKHKFQINLNLINVILDEKSEKHKEKIDEFQNILTFIIKEKQKYQLKLPDHSQQQNKISKINNNQKYEKSKQKQNSNIQQRDQQLEEKDKQISELINNSNKLVQQIKETQKIYHINFNLILINQKVFQTLIRLNCIIGKNIKKKNQQRMVHTNSEKEIIILSYQRIRPKRYGSLMKQNEKYLIQIDVKQKSNTIIDLQNKLFEAKKLSSPKMKNQQVLSLNQEKMLERQKKEDVALQFYKMQQLQVLYLNQMLEISELKKIISEFLRKRNIRNALAEKEKFNNQVNRILNEKQSIEVKLEDDTQTRYRKSNQINKRLLHQIKENKSFNKIRQCFRYQIIAIR